MAPTVPPTPASVNVLATSVADPTKSASASVTIVQVVVVTVSPTNASIPVGMTQQFDASVTGTLNTAVAWSITGAGCSVATCGTTQQPSKPLHRPFDRPITRHCYGFGD